MADVGSFGRGDIAIRGTRIDKMVCNRGVDFEVPQGLKSAEGCEGIYVPRFCTGIWNYSVADIHRNVVRPFGHLARNLCPHDRDIGAGDQVLAISPKVSYCGSENVLQILAQLVSTL